MPGELWQERNGFVSIDGKQLEEPYVAPNRRDTRTVPPEKIPPGRYFMMGDNRVQSCDSREWGTVPRFAISGKAIAVEREGQLIELD